MAAFPLLMPWYRTTAPRSTGNTDAAIKTAPPRLKGNWAKCLRVVSVRYGASSTVTACQCLACGINNPFRCLRAGWKFGYPLPMKSLFACSLLAVAITSGASAQVTISQNGRTLSVSNEGRSAMTAIHLVSADALIESVFRVEPGKTVQRHIITSIASLYRLSEALFEDGHTEGPDNWDIETYKLNHDAAARGGVLLYDDGKSPRESGASLFFANIFSMQFQRLHGYGLAMQDKSQKACVPIGKEGKEQPGYCPPPPKKNPPTGTPEIVGWGTVAVLNGNSTMSGDVCAQRPIFSGRSRLLRNGRVLAATKPIHAGENHGIRRHRDFAALQNGRGQCRRLPD